MAGGCRSIVSLLRFLLLCVLFIFAVNLAVDIAGRFLDPGNEDVDVSNYASVNGQIVANVNLKRTPAEYDDERGIVDVGDEREEQIEKAIVPRIVHIIWFYPENTTFRFHQALCLMSVQKYVKPDRVFFWYDFKPKGAWWKFTLQSIPSLLMFHKQPPTTVFSKPVNVKEHQSDVARMDVLIKYGGIYVDLDVIALRSFDSLLKYDVTIGAETPNLLGSGVILSKRNSTFLNMWFERYRSFNDQNWNYHSGVLPMQLANRHPELIHIDWFAINRPNWFERDWLYTPGKFWDWSGNLAIHLWYQSYNVDHDPHSIRTLNTTVGEIFRYIYYGKPHILPPVT